MNDIVEKTKSIVRREIDKYIKGYSHRSLHAVSYEDVSVRLDVVCTSTIYIDEDNLLANMLSLDIELTEIQKKITDTLGQDGIKAHVILEFKNPSELFMNSNLIYAC